MEHRPKTPQDYKALGDRHLAAGEFAKAEAAYLEALRLSPYSLGATLGLARARREAGKLDLAVKALESALQFNSNEPRLLSTLGAALIEAGFPARAAELLAHARTLAPANFDVAYNLANALRVMGRFAESESHFRAALSVAPADIEARNNLAITLAALSRVDEAIALLQEAIALKPQDTDSVRNLLSISLYDSGLTTAELGRRTKSAVAAWPAAAEAKAPAGRLRPPWRIGWLSSDLHSHPVARNILPVLKAMDRSVFRHVFYSDTRRPDSVTAQFRASTDRWRETASLSDEALAALVRRDEINILVVLAGRFDLNRFLFARYRAAPVQVSFHDVATSALAEMDYFIGDRFLVPPELEDCFTERVARLPSFYIHDPMADAPAIGPPPILGSGRATFGCFANPLKINRSVLRLWARLLQAMPDAQLRLKFLDSYRSSDVKARIMAPFLEIGVGPERLTFSEESNGLRDHLDAYNHVDVALDTFPFSGSTTTFEALCMGVPVVTKPGDMPVSRWTGSMLRTLHLDELIAASDDAYIAIARRLAERPERLVQLRATLRDQLFQSPLCNGTRRGRQLSRLFQAIWGRHRDLARKRGGHAS